MSRCQPGHTPSRGSRGDPLLASSSFCGSWYSLACGRISLISACFHMAFFPVHVKFPPFSYDTSPWTWAHPTCGRECSVAQACPTLCDPVDCSSSGSYPWDFPGKNTRVCCRFLFQRYIQDDLILRSLTTSARK